MKRFTSTYGQSEYDITIQEYGSMEYLFDFLIDNDLSINSRITANQVLIKSDENEFKFEVTTNKNNIINVTKQVERFTSALNQNIFDVCLTKFGTIESMFLFLNDNNLNPNSDLNSNQELIISIDNLNQGNKEIKEYVKLNNIIYTNNSNALATSGDYNNDYNNDYYK